MPRVALVTDSTAGLPPAVAAELGIAVVPASFAFADERILDGAVSWDSVYERMAREGVAPRTFGVAEAGFRDMSLAPETIVTIERLADLEPTTLALMHGSSFQGDGGAQLRRFAAGVDDRFLART